jgi:hypothetical protein
MSKENFKEKEKLVAGPDGGLKPEPSGRLTVGPKIALTLTLTLSCIKFRELLRFSFCLLLEAGS